MRGMRLVYLVCSVTEPHRLCRSLANTSWHRHTSCSSICWHWLHSRDACALNVVGWQGCTSRCSYLRLHRHLDHPCSLSCSLGLADLWDDGCCSLGIAGCWCRDLLHRYSCWCQMLGWLSKSIELRRSV